MQICLRKDLKFYVCYCHSILLFYAIIALTKAQIWNLIKKLISVKIKFQNLAGNWKLRAKWDKLDNVKCKYKICVLLIVIWNVFSIYNS